jgi:hypothetical protein
MRGIGWGDIGAATLRGKYDDGERGEQRHMCRETKEARNGNPPYPDSRGPREPALSARLFQQELLILVEQTIPQTPGGCQEDSAPVCKLP